MLIIGAKGFAKEILEIIHQNGETENLCFYDDVNQENPDKLFGLFPILKSIKEADFYFKNVSDKFVIGLGNPKHREMLFNKFTNIGGKAYTIISKNSEYGSFDNHFEDGVIITSGVVITNSVTIKKGTLINLASTIGHDTSIGAFVEICPNVSISGHCTICDGVFIGTSSTILPNVTVGANAVIAAGSVVRENVAANTMVAGVPAILKKTL